MNKRLRVPIIRAMLAHTQDEDRQGPLCSVLTEEPAEADGDSTDGDSTAGDSTADEADADSTAGDELSGWAHAEAAGYSVIGFNQGSGPNEGVALRDLAGLRHADHEMIVAESVKLIYNYPFGAAGPSALEEYFDGWVFEEKAPNGRWFTRGDLARAVAARYRAIYAEEAETSIKPEAYCAGSRGRATTNGKYQIWGHMCCDLALLGLERIPERISLETGSELVVAPGLHYLVVAGRW